MNLSQQLFGITFGTSNCVDSPENEVAHRMDVFIVANQSAVANDIARGTGETLSSLSKLMQCDSGSALFGDAMQRNFREIFPNHRVQANEVTDSIINVIKTDDTLAGKCKKVS